MPNRLAQETSPYLLQHKDNPVDWYPWGEEALSRARAENKPILLSVGYSACHWCHVMEHESFENAAIARIMNDKFVCIKVDREERPDLDQIYQNVAQAMTQGGGWPLTVFLKPTLEPFYGGTYFPPEDRWGRPGFPRLLEALAKAYQDDTAAIDDNAKKLIQVIASSESLLKAPEGSTPPDRATFAEAANALLSHIDLQHGGLAGAPKFPNPMLFTFLWRSREVVPQAEEAVLITLEKMASGGIFDQLGGGFHRYSVDETWSVPHFEKMLYDNGLLLKLYSEVLLTAEGLEPARQDLFVHTLESTIEYLGKELKSPEGGFYAAQDADSEGEEGKYFVWDKAEVRSYLDEKQTALFCARFGISPGGNFEHGKTVLYVASSIAEAAHAAGVDKARARADLELARVELLKARSERVPPQTDTKLLTAWNGLAVSGLAWAARALNQAGRAAAAKAARALAEAAFECMVSRAAQPQGRLFATIQEGQPKLDAYLDDYAYLALAGLDLARFADDPSQAKTYVERAGLWCRTILRDFKGGTDGEGYYFTSDSHEKLVHRPKTVFDQAIPSGTSVALEVLGALAEMDWDGRAAEFEKELEAQLSGLFHLARRSPHGSTALLLAALQHQVGPAVISGPGAGGFLAHPWLFQKAPDAVTGPDLVICRQKACKKAGAARQLGEELAFR